MAESILFTLASNTITILGSLASQELGLLWGFHDEFDKLKHTVSAIKAVILDAEEKQKNRALKEWISRLKDAFYDIDNLMDEFSYESLRRQVMTKGRTNCTKQVRIFFSKSNQIAFRLKMAHKIKGIREKLDVVDRDKAQFNLSENIMEIRDEWTKRLESSSFILEGEVIGRDDDRKVIVDFLLDTNTKKDKVAVIAIIGMGGLGKTALAQSIYWDENVKKHFELTMWVCISVEFDVKVIVEKIIESLTKKRPEPNLQLDTLQNMLREKIDGKKYLLVMDDVWNVDREKWMHLKRYLMGGAKGSRILITTRTHQVAQTSETVFSHHLKELNEDNSWELFSKMAFSNESEMIENSKLVVIGKEIATKLKGFPLLIRVIGSHLYSKKSEKIWLSLKDNELNTIMQQSNEIQSILKIGFNKLSSSLKHCFTYCVLYPKGYEIPKDELIKQWMAQGFIQPEKGKAIEDVGDDNFKKLLGKSFFQDIKKDKWGEIKKFKIHDLMHDLAYSVVENDCVFANDDTKSIDNGTRHVSLFSVPKERWGLKIAKSLIKAKNLRTLNHDPFYQKIDICNHLRLRTLNFEDFTHFPKCIGKMKHLRYLEFSYNRIDFLPKFVTKLYNLETLIIRHCYELRELPSDIKDLINLRHLDIMDCDSDFFSHMPKGLGSMTSLQTMNRFVLGNNKGGKLSELNGLNNLRGSLKIDELQFCKTSDLKNAKYLEEKSGIRILELYWNTYEMESKMDDEALELYLNTYEMKSKIDDEDEKVLECLKPHPNLQKICIRGYRGVKLCDWLSFDYIANLAIIKLFYLKNLHHLPRFDQFPFLKYLLLEGLWSIEYIDNNNYDSSSTTFFPSLEKLSIIELPKLKKWWKGEIIDQNTSFPTMNSLSRLKIFRCRQLGSIPQHGPLQSLEIYDVSLQLFELVMKMATTKIAVGEDSSSSANNVFIRSLSSLGIGKIDYEFLPHHLFSNMAHLKSFVIESCMNLKISSHDDGVIWKELRSLRTLQLQRIPKLEYLPKGFQYMTTLERLELRDCSNLVCIKEIGHLNSLSQLIIVGCPNLTSLPQEMAQLTSLSRLEIRNCNRLTSLPQLTSLSELEIGNCDRLTSLGQGMSLSRLIINSCSETDASLSHRMRTFTKDQN